MISNLQKHAKSVRVSHGFIVSLKLTFSTIQLAKVNGSRDGAVVKALASHQCRPGSILALCHMWVEFVVGYRRAPRVFSPGTPVFLLPKKSTFPNSNLTKREGPHENQRRLMSKCYNLKLTWQISRMIMKRNTESYFGD